MTQSKWRWATYQDIPQIVKLAQQDYEWEIGGIFTASPERYQYNLALAITNQHYNAALEQILVCSNDLNLQGYSWISRGQHLPYAEEEFAEAKVLHLSRDLTARTRVRMIRETLTHWENWARVCGIPVIISSTIRSDQEAFMRLHEQQGYTRRGSIAYKKI